MIKLNQASLFSGILLFALSAPAFADERSWLSNTYVTANIGSANSGASVDEVQAEFNDAGIMNTSINSVEDRRFGYGIGLGYEILPFWSFELAYLDLGQVDVDFTSIQAINNLENAHPESGDGFTFSVLYKHSFDPKTPARLRLGVFDWTADYKTTQGNGTSSGTDSDSGTDVYWGAGMGYELTEEFTLIGEIQRFDFDRDDTIYLAISTEWRF